MTEAFVAACVAAVQRLHREGIVEAVFGVAIPVLVHELEYYDQIASGRATRVPDRSVNRALRGSHASARTTSGSALASSGGRYGDGDAACSPGSRADGSSSFAGCGPSTSRRLPRTPTTTGPRDRLRRRQPPADPQDRRLPRGPRTSQRLGAGAKLLGAWRVRRAQSAAAPTVTQSCRIPHAQCCRSNQR
jgi:hypothetical protein